MASHRKGQTALLQGNFEQVSLREKLLGQSKMYAGEKASGEMLYHNPD